MKAEDMQRLERTERMMIRWMRGVRLSDKKASAELHVSRLDRVFQVLLDVID